MKEVAHDVLMSGDEGFTDCVVAPCFLRDGAEPEASTISSIGVSEREEDFVKVDEDNRHGNGYRGSGSSLSVPLGIRLRLRR